MRSICASSSSRSFTLVEALNQRRWMLGTGRGIKKWHSVRVAVVAFRPSTWLLPCATPTCHRLDVSQGPRATRGRSRILPVGHRREDLRREPLGEDQRPLLVAGRADAALFAGEGDEELVLAGAALHRAKPSWAYPHPWFKVPNSQPRDIRSARKLPI